MIRSILVTLSLILGLLSGCNQPSPSTASNSNAGDKSISNNSDRMFKHYKVNGEFAEIQEFLELAITERGLNIENVSHIGKMLSRTKEDVGGKKDLYSNAKSFQFCSATVSRAMMEADPRNIVLCPYIIYIYEMVDMPSVIHIAFRRPIGFGDAASAVPLQEVEKLLDRIIADVVK